MYYLGIDIAKKKHRTVKIRMGVRLEAGICNFILP